MIRHKWEEGIVMDFEIPTWSTYCYIWPNKNGQYSTSTPMDHEPTKPALAMNMNMWSLETSDQMQADPSTCRLVKDTMITLGTSDYHSQVPFCNKAYVWGIRHLNAHREGIFLQWRDTATEMAKVLDEEVEE